MLARGLDALEELEGFKAARAFAREIGYCSASGNGGSGKSQQSYTILVDEDYTSESTVKDPPAQVHHLLTF